MNDRQNAKLHMYKATSKTCHDNEPIWVSVPAIARVLDELDNLIAAIEQAAQQQKGAEVKGVTKDKNSAQESLVRSCLKVSGPLSVLAYEAKNQELLVKVTINKSTLYKAHDNDALTIAKNVAAEAASRAEALEEYGIANEDIEQLTADIDVFGSYIVKPRDTTTDHKQYTGSLSALFSLADSVLYDKLDNLIVPFKDKNPEFVEKYRSSRMVINTSVRKKKEEEMKN